MSTAGDASASRVGTQGQGASGAAPAPSEAVGPDAAGPADDAAGPADDGRDAANTATATAPAFGVVGIVGSAGALEAFQALFDRLPAHTGLAFVVVPHLDPTHRSLMPQLLASHTRMPVQEIHDGLRLQPDQVYVIPPGFRLGFNAGVLHLAPLDEGTASGREAVIDRFLRALAADQHQRAIAIVLSGTGAHGTLGLREIQEQGGLTLVQEPATARFDAMPRSAIRAGVADRVLSPRALAQHLVEYARYAERSGLWQTPTPEVADMEQLASVLALLRARTRCDFRPYRKKMLMRRIRRRMGLCHAASLPDYLTRLRSDSNEVSLLFNDLLIGVTRFFRDPPALDLLVQRVLEPLIEAHLRRGLDETPIRVWVPGCATGEEAYSIAMLLFEGFARRQSAPLVQVFATDVDEDALEIARQGLYPKSIAADVCEQRLRRFFVEEGEDRYCIDKRLRELVVVAPQNLITDAPFSKLDLISCRNLLIYLEPEVQQRIIGLFHFALNPGGHLLLGPSETVGSQSDQFEIISKKWRLFRRGGSQHAQRVWVPTAVRMQRPSAALAPLAEGPARPATDLAGLAQRVLLDEYGPGAVLVNRHDEILYFFGPAADYLELPPGRPTLDLTAMVRQGLRTRVRAACSKALTEQTPVTVDNLRVKRNGRYVPVQMRVTPLRDTREADSLLLVSFIDVDKVRRQPQTQAPAPPPEAGDAGALAKQLEQELRATRQELQTTVEEMESANEELKASHEEAMSMNEELQSANEELETSREELQSLNEELSTVNSQLEDKVQELEQSNNDISNLLASTEIATVFLDTALLVKRFTPRAMQLLNLRAADIDRPLRDLSPNVSDPALLADAQQVLDRLVPLEQDIAGEQDSRFLRRIQPYRTQDNRIGGVVVTFVDISERARAEQALRASESRYRLMFERSPLCLLEQDWSHLRHCLAELSGEQGPALVEWVQAHPEPALNARAQVRVSAVNAAAWRLVGVQQPDADGLVAEQCFPLQPAAGFLALLAALLQGRSAVQELEVHPIAGARIPVLVHAVPIPGHHESLARVLVAVIDITERKAIELALKEREQRLQAIFSTVGDGLLGVAADGTVTQVNPAAERLFGGAGATLVGCPLARLLRPAPSQVGSAGEELMSLVRRANQAPATPPWRCDGLRADGSQFPAEVSSGEVDHLGFYVLLVRDVSQRLELERQVIESSTREQERIGQEMHDGLGQQLAAVSLLAKTLAGKLEQAGRAEAGEAASLADHLQQLLADSRRIVQGLAPAGLASQQLPGALERLARQLEQATGVVCRVHLEGPLQALDPVLASHLYRIAQEALNNAVRHGQPTHIAVQLALRAGWLELTVRDDGTWVETGPPGQDGLGLYIMGYRAGILGGTLEVSPAEGGGTQVRCTLPVPRQASPAAP